MYQLYNSYSNDEKDKKILAAFLFEELSLMRGKPISSASSQKWRLLAGVSRIYRSKLVSDPRRLITPREAAGIILVALWEPLLRDKVMPSIRSSQITPLDVANLFNTWMQKTGGKEATKILTTHFNAEMPTYKQVARMAENQAKKPLPISTLKRWTKQLGGLYRVNDVCPPKVVLGILLNARGERLNLSNVEMN